MSSGLIAVFRSMPKELFRVNNGRKVKLREWSTERHVFDIISENGRVKPKALHPSTYKAPNGASMRPNSPYQHHLVSRLFRGPDVVVFSVPVGRQSCPSKYKCARDVRTNSCSGTRLPTDLVLVHERSDHYSLQPAKEMTIDDLNSKITSFLLYNGICYTRDEWLNTYRAASEFPPW